MLANPYVPGRWEYRALTTNYRTPSEIMAVVCHERFTLDNLTEATVPAERLDEFNKYCVEDAPEFVKAEDQGAAYPLYATPPPVAAG